MRPTNVEQAWNQQAALPQPPVSLARIAPNAMSARAPDAQPEWHATARAHGLSPVFADWTQCYAINADGQPVAAENSDWSDVRVLSHRRLRHVVLAQAARRLPECAHLAPARNASNPICQSCEGRGEILAGIICWCGGAGWLPAGVPQASEAQYADDLTWIENDVASEAG